MDNSSSTPVIPKEPTRTKRGRGRPSKKELSVKNPRGRPKGDNSAIAEFKARLLASPKSKKVFETILDAALNDEHKNQAAAWKLVVDRLLPMSYFEKDASGGRPSVNITISGIGSVGVSGEESTPDYIDVEPKDAC